jgi:hypothetical protein
MNYRFALNERAVFFLQKSTSRDRRLLLDEFARLTSNPFAPPDYVKRSPAERDLQIRQFRCWQIFYWIDHADCEVRITEIRIVKP